MRNKHRLFWMGGMLAGAVALGCQTAPQVVPGGPRMVVHYGAVKLEPDADMAVVFNRLDCKESDYALQQAAGPDPRVDHIKVEITGTGLVDPLKKTLTRSQFTGCDATLNLTGLAPGQYQVRFTSYNAAGDPVAYANGAATVALGTTPQLNLVCDFNMGSLDVNIHCCASPPPSAPPSPVPSATPSPAPTPTPVPTPTATPFAPTDIAVDQSGNLWTANMQSDNVTKYDSMGNIIAHYPAGVGAFSLAFEDAGTLWVADYSSNKLTHLSAAGSFLGEVPTAGSPLRIRRDPQNNLWVTLSGIGSRAVQKFSPAGALLGTFTIGTSTPGVGANPHSIAFDATGNAWITGNRDNSVTKIGLSGAPKVAYTNGLNGPWGVAIDSNGNAWVSNQVDDTVTKLSSTGSVLDTFATEDYPTAVLVDTSDDVWIANYGSRSVTRLASDGSFKERFPVGLNPQSLAQGLNDDIWVANRSSNSITRIPR